MIHREQAAKEVNDWLDHKKISPRKREKYQDYIEILVDSICEGYLIFNDDKSIKHKLKFPIEGEMSITELTFKPRLTVKNTSVHTQGVKATDNNGIICAYICALTSTAKEVIKGLDTEDYEIASSIGVFFL